MAYPMGFPPQGTVADTRTSTIVVAASNSLDPTLAPLLYRCTGVNDEVEMNAALVAAAAVNGSVELLEGDYNTVLTLSVAVNVTLKAVGWGAVINFDASGNAITIAGDNVKLRDFKVVIVAGAGGVGTRPNNVYATGRTNVEITQLWLVGDQTVGSDGSDDRQIGILFGINMAYSKIAFCTIEGYERNGMNLEGTVGNEVVHIEVEGNIVYNIDNDGIRLEYAQHITISGNTLQDNDNGLYITTSEYNTVTGNTFQGNIANGIYLRSDFNTISGNTFQGNGNGHYMTGDYNTVSGNTFQGNTINGIYLSGSNHSTLTGNLCNGNTNHGIYLSNSSDNTVTGNTCSENDSGTTGTYDGISLDTASGNIILGNQCQDNDRWGVFLTGSSDNKIAHNHTEGNTSGSIRINEAASSENTVEFNTTEEGALANAGTNTRAYGNYDPSANAFVGDVGAAPW